VQKKYTPLHNETLQVEKKKGLTKCTQICAQNINPYLLRVVPLGIEPRLFCTKNRRVASYTMGQFDANLLSIFYPTKYFF
jgi:hypothetical protein